MDQKQKLKEIRQYVEYYAAQKTVQDRVANFEPGDYEYGCGKFDGRIELAREILTILDNKED
jgi:hypothetical protein